MRNAEISELRYMDASALAAAVPSGIVFGLASCALVTESWWGTGTDLDDAPRRVVGFGIVLSLPMFLFYLVVFYLAARVLALFRWLSFGSLAFSSIGLASIALYWQTVGLGGWRVPEIEEIRSFGIFCLTFASFTLLATYIWWRVAHNQRRTASLPLGRC